MFNKLTLSGFALLASAVSVAAGDEALCRDAREAKDLENIRNFCDNVPELNPMMGVAAVAVVLAVVALVWERRRAAA